MEKINNQINQKKIDFLLNFDDIKNKPFRHKRLYNLIAIPVQELDNFIVCEVGNGVKESIPKGYFQRDWKLDESIDYNDLIKEMMKFDKDVLYSIYYNLKIDNFGDLYLIYFDENEKSVYPEWKIRKFNKEERIKLNPFTLIMPVKEEKIEEVKQDLIHMNKIRKQNENVEFDEILGFEFALIKLLEEKYLKEL